MYPGSIHVEELGLRSKDKEIWDHSLGKGLAVISKDSDFEAIALVKAPPGKAVLVTLGNCTTENVANLLRDEEKRIKVFLASPQETLLVIP